MTQLTVERNWAIERYNHEFHFSVVELRQVFYALRAWLENHWGVDWGAKSKFQVEFML
jgi:hypothetical protein